MTGQDAFADYSQKRLGGRPIPDDLRALLQLQWQRPSPEQDPLAFIDARLLEADEGHDLLDHSYLRPDDLQNPDIVANVSAIKAVCQHAAFVAIDTGGNLFGYWFGPEQLPIHAAPIIRLDTEGCFHLAKGKTLAEALLGYSLYSDDEDFVKLREWFAKFDVLIEPTSWNGMGTLTASTQPADMHSQLYNEGRRARGLPPVED